MSRDEFPALKDFFDCYFHQDALLGDKTPADVAREFAESEDPRVVAAARMEVVAMLALPDAELRRSRCLPVDWEFGDGTRAFLIELRQAWDESVAGIAGTVESGDTAGAQSGTRDTSRHWSRIIRGEPATCYLAVGGYFASHGRNMGVILHDGNLPWGDHVIITGVSVFHGALEGGPYTLRLTEGEKTPERLLVGVGDAGDVSILFEGDFRLDWARWGQMASTTP